MDFLSFMLSSTITPFIRRKRFRDYRDGRDNRDNRDNRDRLRNRSRYRKAYPRSHYSSYSPHRDPEQPRYRYQTRPRSSTPRGRPQAYKTRSRSRPHSRYKRYIAEEGEGRGRREDKGMGGDGMRVGRGSIRERSMGKARESGGYGSGGRYRERGYQGRERKISRDGLTEAEEYEKERGSSIEIGLDYDDTKPS
eukprot:1294873-Amorphochlora_amoeboformis.AAC.1